MGVTRIVHISASRVAAVAGLHRYCDARQALLDQWYATDRHGCLRAIQRWTPRDTIDGAVLNEDDRSVFARAYDEAMNAVSGAALGRAIEEAPEGRVRDAVRREAYRDRGNRDEAGALDAVETRTGTAVTGRNAHLFRRELLEADNMDGSRIVIVGRVDGWREAEGEIVEVKNRARRLFDSVPLYERVQVQVYMWLTGAKRCRLVQQFEGETKEEVLDRDPAFLDDTVWPDLVHAIEHCLLPLLSDDPEAQRELLGGGLLPEAYVAQANNWTRPLASTLPTTTTCPAP